MAGAATIPIQAVLVATRRCDLLLRCRTKSMDETLNRGRWGNIRVARIYVNDGLAKEVELILEDDERRRVDLKAAALLHWIQRQ